MAKGRRSDTLLSSVLLKKGVVVRRFVLLLGTMLLAVLLMSGVALSQETVQGTIDANCQLVNVGLGAWQPLAQTFTAGNDGRITDITLGASVPGTSEGTGDVVVQIITLD